MIAFLKRLIAGLLIACLALPAHAGMLPTEAERAYLFTLIERDEVRAELRARGVDPNEVKARVAAMTDEELAELAGKIDALPAGGADLLSVAFAVFIILLITDILGFTKVFPFTRSAR